MTGGWIKLYRALLEDPVWTTATADQKAVLVTILLLANHEPRQWAWMGQKFDIQAGQLITSLASLAKKAGVSVKSVRSAITRFEKLDFLANKSAKTGRLISIKNWSSYQGLGLLPGKEVGKDRAKTGQLSRMKEGKKEIPYPEIVAHLNDATGKKYRSSTGATQAVIKARWNEGFRLEDFKAVICNQAADWGNKPNMAKYLRPETLFGPKFEGYLNSSPAGQRTLTESSGDTQHQQAAAEIARHYGLE